MKLLILDLDGTVRRPKSGAKFINDPEDQEIIPEARNAIARYASDGWTIVGCTNQGGVAAKHKTLESAIKEQFHTSRLSGHIREIFFCPDYNGDICYRTIVAYLEKEGQWEEQLEQYNRFCPNGTLYQPFRKPGSGMIELAMDAFPKALEYQMVGDRDEDYQAAQAANIPFLWAQDWWK